MAIKRTVANRVADLLALMLRAFGESSYRFFVEALWTRHPSFSSSGGGLEVRLHRPPPISPPASERALAERIFKAYGRAVTAQREVDPVFLPSSMWQGIIDRAYAPLLRGLARDDLDTFHRFLANFGASQEATGIEQSRLVHECSRDAARRRHYERQIVAPLLSWWLRVQANGRDLAAVALPPHGNIGGALVDGHLVTPSAIFSEVYSRLLTELLPQGRPVLAELGGGYGRFAYYLTGGLERFCYVDLDLPETLCCASYFLLKTFPDRRFLLYGEGELTAATLDEVDFVLWPAFDIGRLEDRSVDLFINENSLGMMTAAACRLYVTEICRTTRIFWHRNHTVRRLRFEDGSASLLSPEYPVTAEFAQVAQHPDLTSLMDQGRPNFDSDMAWHLYVRRAAGSGRLHPGLSSLATGGSERVEPKPETTTC